MMRTPLLHHASRVWNRLTRLLSGPDPAWARDPSDDAIRYPSPGIMLVAWSAVGALSSSRFFAVPGKPETASLSLVLIWIACYAPWALLSPVVFRLERRFPLRPGGWSANLPRLALISAPVALLGSFLMHGAVSATWALLDLPPTRVRSWWAPLRDLLPAVVCFWSSVAIGYFVRTQAELRAHERRTARLALEKSRLEAGLNRAQLEVLRAKLNPHFLFNSLQNISVLTGTDPGTASLMLTRLGDLLRAVLRQNDRPETPLHEELDLTRAYVALEQLRFGDRMQVQFAIHPDTTDALVPCFILQPLIENAVVHGLRSVRSGGVIAVHAKREAGNVILRVEDNGVGLPVADLSTLTLGVGLGSTRERLERMYPGQHTLRVNNRPEGGAAVRITLPYHV